jgi:predicted type IV restriction endonuclease
MKSVPVSNVDSWLSAASTLEAVNKQVGIYHHGKQEHSQLFPKTLTFGIAYLLMKREHIGNKLRSTRQCLEEERIQHQYQLEEQRQSHETEVRLWTPGSSHCAARSMSSILKFHAITNSDISLCHAFMSTFS